MMKHLIISIGAYLLFITSCGQTTDVNKQSETNQDMNEHKTDTITLGGGCFWCTEAVFQQLNGVYSVTSGYSGGHINNPSYREVCGGQTGHVECIQIRFNPDTISLVELLDVFFRTHGPTKLNRQGNDVGSQYRSIVFYQNNKQKELTEKYINTLNESEIWDKPIVTEVTEANVFYQAEDYHQDYYNLNNNQPYCRYVIEPKLDILKNEFKNKLKKQTQKE
jgi:peptide-methionine (S)-S-oxide reductase